MSFEPTDQIEDGFRVLTRWDDSTVCCPCGGSFTWEGFDAKLDEWKAKHRPHLDGTNEQKEAG